LIGTRRANAWKPNPRFVEQKRRPNERTNIAWLERAAPADHGRVEILLVGGRRSVDFRLRVAQSHVRHDLTPSHWSHACLLGPRDAKNLANTMILETSLEPSRGFGYPPPRNAVQLERLGRYRSVRDWPNVATLQIPLARAKIEDQVLEVFRSRSVVDLVALSLRWLGFAWGVADAGNPLLDGVGIPSTVLVQTLVGAAGFDITPSLPARASCPEAIWQATTWWHDYYRGVLTADEAAAPVESNADLAITGAWCVGHRLVTVKEPVTDIWG
jgi:hypothetical protein